MMLCVATCNAQAAVSLVERLGDGSFVVSVDGREYRALGPEKMRELAKQKIDLETATKINTELTRQVEILILERDLAKSQSALIQQKADSFEADFNRSREDAKRNFNLFIGERELRRGAQQFIPHGKASGFGGKILSFLDSSYAQAVWKLAVPTWQLVKCQ